MILTFTVIQTSLEWPPLEKATATKAHHYHPKNFSMPIHQRLMSGVYKNPLSIATVMKLDLDPYNSSLGLFQFGFCFIETFWLHLVFTWYNMYFIKIEMLHPQKNNRGHIIPLLVYSGHLFLSQRRLLWRDLTVLLVVLHIRRCPWHLISRWAATVCPKVAVEANPGKKASRTSRAEVGICCEVGAGGSGLPCSTLIFCSAWRLRLYSTGRYLL